MGEDRCGAQWKVSQSRDSLEMSLAKPKVRRFEDLVNELKIGIEARDNPDYLDGFCEDSLHCLNPK